MKKIIFALGAVALAIGVMGTQAKNVDQVPGYDTDAQQIATVEQLAKKWGVNPEQLFVIAENHPEVMDEKAIDSVGGFNPFSVDFLSWLSFDADKTLTADQKYKWLRYRREEIGVCFEDEELNEFGICEWDGSEDK